MVSITTGSCVIGNGMSSSVVTSGLPQSTVPGPLHFLFCVVRLPESISSFATLFADDCLVYYAIPNGAIKFQEDLDQLGLWVNA